jgi:hypothetical protein
MTEDIFTYGTGKMFKGVCTIRPHNEVMMVTKDWKPFHQVHDGWAICGFTDPKGIMYVTHDFQIKESN